MDVDDDDIPDYLWGVAGMKKPGAKAGRRVRGDKLGVLKDFQRSIRKLMKDLGDVLGWADYKGEPTPTKAGMKVFEGPDGKPWLLTWTTNSFEDRDKETFTAKAIEEYVDRHADEESKGDFWFWHLPGTKFGSIAWQGMSGRFLVEAGPFDETPIGETFAEFFKEHPDGHPIIAPEGWGTSHGFTYKAGDRRDGVYDWFEKQETTVLPGHVAANPYNLGMEVFEVDTKQRDALKAIGGEELADLVVQLGEGRTKELEEAGVSFKATLVPKVEAIIASTKDAALKAALQAAVKAGLADEKAGLAVAAAKAKGADAKALEPILAELVEPTEPEPAPEPTPGEGGEVAALRSEFGTAMKAVAESVNTRLTGIETGLNKLLQAAGETEMMTPRASRKSIATSVIGTEKTRVDGRTSLGRAAPAETETEDAGPSGIPLIGRIKALNSGAPKVPAA
jgi:hypothetical protein